MTGGSLVQRLLKIRTPAAAARVSVSIRENPMTERNTRAPGYYWVNWSKWADSELAARRPGPLVGEWDGKVWWFSRVDAYQFDCDLIVISNLSLPRDAPSTTPHVRATT
jgi:hypothetical protein